MSNDVADHLAALCTPNPWAHSQEGSDDACHFCGSPNRPWEPLPGDPHWQRVYTYIHDDDCAWIAAVDFLGWDRRTDRHFTRSENR